MEPARFTDAAIARLRAEIPGRAILAASGGIDSTVAGALAQRALGDRLRAIFVDTGLLRDGERERVSGYLSSSGLAHEVVSAEDRFFAALEGVADPEEKRRRIGRAFIRLFEEEAQRFGTDQLVQGTIAPDWIESGTLSAPDGAASVRDRIKTHHNVGGVPADSRLRLVEPIRELYKDEVRALARHLRIPEPERQPFPGPGLAVRVPGPVSPERIRRARVANRIVEEEIDRASASGRMPRPWQYFAVLLPAPTVGVLGDNRVRADAVSVRAVASVDAMTATSIAIPPDVLTSIAERITRELSGQVVRVLYDITDKPPATIEWE